MNRQQRRELKKQQKPAKKPSWHNLTAEERKAALVKNGITANDLKREWNLGYDTGLADGGKPTIEMVFACACLALNEHFGFGKKRCVETLNSMNYYMTQYLSSREAIQAVFGKIGLAIDFEDDPFEPVREVEE